MKKIVCLLLLIPSMLCISCGKESRIKKGSVDKYVFQFLLQDAENSPVYKGSLAFAQKLNELSGGTMTVEFNEADNVTDISKLIEPVISGEFDIAITEYTYLAYAIPELELIAQAYVVTDYDNFIKTLDSDYGRNINKAILKLGLVPSEIWFLGTAHVTSNDPIYSLTDFRGLRLRTPPSDANVAFAESMGAVAMPTSLSGLYNALKTKYINAQENPLSTAEAHKIYELQKYIAITGHSIRASSLLINKKIYDSFSEQQEAWYKEAAQYGREICSQIVAEEEEYLLEKFQHEYGMTVTYPNIDELKKAMYPIYDKIEEKYGKGSVYSLVAIE